MSHTHFARAARALVASLLLASLLLPVPARVSAVQKRDHLTPEEIEIVRDTQALDGRTGVFIKAAERRLLALTDPASKQLEKDREKWGEVKGTRAQLLADLAKILDEAIVNIDDTAERTPESSLLKKSLHKLAEAANRFLPQLTPIRDSTQDEAERKAVEEAIEKAQEIIEASMKHPLDDKEKSGSKKKGN